ncbi:pentatricopeptide repeat-containing protein At3g16610-like [Primulina huaijiensis]|uniref:pentatricopeptide repeat-containing protein At3g16610-like n=1 Tax=Primulina huaijiensis TaxID=1492673 RepID=UPI003CC77D2D
MVDSEVTPTNYTYPFVLKACSTLQDMDICLVEAREMFDGMPERDVVAWNAMDAGFSSYGLCLDAIGLVSEMQNNGVEPNSSTIVAILSSIANTCRLREGKASHGFCIKRDFHVDAVAGTGLLNIYGKCGQLVHAKHLFET